MSSTIVFISLEYNTTWWVHFCCTRLLYLFTEESILPWHLWQNVKEAEQTWKMLIGIQFYWSDSLRASAHLSQFLTKPSPCSFRSTTQPQQRGAAGLLNESREVPCEPGCGGVRVCVLGYWLNSKTAVPTADSASAAYNSSLSRNTHIITIQL